MDRKNLGVAVAALLAAGCGGDGSRPQCPDCSREVAPACHRFVCNVKWGVCEAEPLEDGAACDSLESCSYGDACRDGACIPGTAIDCVAPTCQQATCDPVTDTCVDAPADEGEPCAMPCVPAGVCAEGVCVGDATDCSWLGDECNTGECHPDLGDCYLAPVETDTPCTATDPGCASASCDGDGACVDAPLGDGTPCDDGDRCTSADGCQDGACTGTAISACADGDGCCPSGCAADVDCCTVAGPQTDPSAWRFEGLARYDADAGHVQLTPARNWSWGQIWLRHEVFAPFVARFRFRAAMAAGSADGLVIMFYKDADYVPAAGGDLSFDAGDGCNVDAPGTGYGIEIDNWQNGCDASANHVALIHQRVGGHLAAVDDARTFDGAWHDMAVTVDVGSVTVTLDGDTILTWTGAIDRTFGGLGFGAATGGANDEYVVDDIEIDCL
jgi:hypothetical protein